MDRQANISAQWSPRMRWSSAELRPAPCSLAVGLSVALHVAAAGWALSLEPVPPKVSSVVAPTHFVRAVHQDIVLERPAPPPVVAPAPAPKPAIIPPKPVAAKPPPKKRRKRVSKRKKIAKPTTAFEQKAPTPAAAPVKAPAPAAVPIHAPAADAGVAVQTSAPTGDVGENTAAVDPRAGHVDGAADGEGVDLSGYGARVRAAVQRRQHYPESAEADGLEGTVRVKVSLRPDGSLVAPPKVVRSSGHRSLDKEAVRMVRASAPFMKLPAGFKTGTAELTIPIVFELEEDDF